VFEQLSMFRSSTASEPFTVSQLTGQIRRLLEGDPSLRDIWVEGEVSNFSRATSGHCYFTLKDPGSEISCVMWRSMADKHEQLPHNGESVLARGYVGVYEPRGRYQLYVERLRAAGIGDLYRRFELLKSRLEAEGLFAPERKLPLPVFPRRIGVVTSPSTAALRDIVSVVGRRYPLAELIVAPTPVQGESAPPQIVTALEQLDARDDIDVIIVARGGGSLEDLWPFNDEAVARAIAGANTPVVCGVGHETDFSLADFAADARAPTPSAAAEMAVPDQMQLRERLTELAASGRALLYGILASQRSRLAELARALRASSPASRVAQARQRLDDLVLRGETVLGYELSMRRERLLGLRRQLAGIGPTSTLERGYSIVRHRESGAIVRGVGQVTSGDSLDIQVSDGTFGSRVE
jgi:exodeoxyribonuclease VII large subunit